MFDVRFLKKLLGYPPVFYRKDGDLTADLSNAFVVAHNAGDRLSTSRASVEHHADVVEIDLISKGGRLFAAHPRDAWIFSRIGIPTLDPDLAWAQAAQAPAVKLDLKEESPQFLRLALDFVANKTETPLLFVTRSPFLIEAFQREAPHVIRVLSTRPDALARLKADDALAARIHGVSAHQDEFTPHTIAWANERGLFTMAGVVKSFARADALITAGVNGIITDNLALMKAIGGHSDIRKILKKG